MRVQQLPKVISLCLPLVDELLCELVQRHACDGDCHVLFGRVIPELHAFCWLQDLDIPADTLTEVTHAGGVGQIQAVQVFDVSLQPVLIGFHDQRVGSTQRGSRLAHSAGFPRKCGH